MGLSSLGGTVGGSQLESEADVGQAGPCVGSLPVPRSGGGTSLVSTGPCPQPPSAATSLGPLSLGLGGGAVGGARPQGPCGFENSVH